jgi:hypothetical protein
LKNKGAWVIIITHNMEHAFSAPTVSWSSGWAVVGAREVGDEHRRDRQDDHWRGIHPHALKSGGEAMAKAVTVLGE